MCREVVESAAENQSLKHLIEQFCDQQAKLKSGNASDPGQLNAFFKGSAAAAAAPGRGGGGGGDDAESDGARGSAARYKAEYRSCDMRRRILSNEYDDTKAAVRELDRRRDGTRRTLEMLDKERKATEATLERLKAELGLITVSVTSHAPGRVFRPPSRTPPHRSTPRSSGPSAKKSTRKQRSSIKRRTSWGRR